MYALLARGIIAGPPDTDADAVVAALPVRWWHDKEFFPLGVEVATQSCWQTDACSSLEGGEDETNASLNRGDAPHLSDSRRRTYLAAPNARSRVAAAVFDDQPFASEVVMDDVPSDHAVPLILSKLGDHANVTPEAERKEVLHRAHVFGHRGTRGTMHRLLADGHKWPGMRSVSA